MVTDPPLRSAEFPDIPVEAQLRFLPPVVAPQHEWNSSKIAALAQLLPVADTHSPQRPRVLKIPGPFIDYRPNIEDEGNLEQHLRKTEEESIGRSEAAQSAEGAVRLLDGESGTYYSPYRMDARFRYRHHKRIQESRTTAASMDTRPDSAVFMEAVKVEFVKASTSVKESLPAKTRSFRRLTLGDISPELGKLWDD